MGTISLPLRSWARHLPPFYLSSFKLAKLFFLPDSVIDILVLVVRLGRFKRKVCSTLVSWSIDRDSSISSLKGISKFLVTVQISERRARKSIEGWHQWTRKHLQRWSNTYSKRLGMGIVWNRCSSGSVLLKVLFLPLRNSQTGSTGTGKLFVSPPTSSAPLTSPPPAAKSFHLMSFQVTSQSATSPVQPGFWGCQEVMGKRCFNPCGCRKANCDPPRQHHCKEATQGTSVSSATRDSSLGFHT